MGKGTSLLVVAGEVSGDMHAAGLVRELRALRPELEVFGIGGDGLEAQGAELLYHVRDMAVFGFFAVLGRITFFRKVFRHLLREAESRKPDLAVLVDYGGFNIRFAEQLKARGIPVVYYVSPQVWASRKGRIPRIAAAVDRLIVIFPFEPEVYAGTGLQVDYVGHPLVDEAAAAAAAPQAELPWGSGARVALLPGSREQEIARILPTMIEAALLIAEQVPDISWLIAAPSEDIAQSILEKLAGLPRAEVKVVVGETREVLRQADAAMVASGTATLETALMKCPMIVTYKTSSLLYWVARSLVQLDYIGMVNIIAGRELCPEYVQGDATPKALAEGLVPILTDADRRAAMLNGFEEVAARLGEPGAAQRAAAIVDQLLKDRHPVPNDEN